MSEILEKQDISKRRRPLYRWTKKLKKPFITVAYSLFMLGAILILWFGITRTALFTLTKVEVAGPLHILDKEKIISAAKVPVGKNLFRVSLKTIEQNVATLKWVNACSVRRQAPDTLWITVQEQNPKAILLSDKLYFISEEGKIFKEVEQEPTRDLPVLTGFQTPPLSEKSGGEKEDFFAEPLKLIDFFDQNRDFTLFGLSEIHYNEAIGFSIVTMTGPMEVKLGKENFETKLNRFKNILDHLPPTLKTVRGIDLDYDDKAFVKI